MKETPFSVNARDVALIFERAAERIAKGANMYSCIALEKAMIDGFVGRRKFITESATFRSKVWDYVEAISLFYAEHFKPEECDDDGSWFVGVATEERTLALLFMSQIALTDWSDDYIKRVQEQCSDWAEEEEVND